MIRIPHATGRRRHRVLSVAAIIAASLLLFQAAAYGILSGSPSNFESNDGNMTHLTGNHDWDNVAFTHVTDVASSQSDDSFVSGQKQDAPCPDLYLHGNPPKDDFTDVASFSETNTSTKDTYLYGATIRYTANGNASENVELKQGTAGFCTGSTLLARVPGDKLIAIDYLNGGTNVVFHVLTWIATGACFVGNDTAPCWGANVLTLTAAGAEGLASQAAITAANNPISGKALVAGQFAEFGVNLRLAGIIPAGTCKAFPQTVWESRSSGSSFVSTTKDVSIENKTISNCGEVVIIKHSDPRGADQDFNFTSDLSGSELSCTQATATSFTLNDVGNTTGDSAGNTQDCTNVPAGTYHVTEGADPPGFSFDSLTCSVGGVVVGKQATITINPGDTVTCVYTNKVLHGAIEILKNSTKGGPVNVAGAIFSYDNGAGSSGSVTDNGNGDEDGTVGVVCVSGLVAGSTYTVLETSPPVGYGGGTTLDNTADAVAGTDCTTTLPGSGGTVTYTEPPLSDIQVRFRDGGSGETSATISCDNQTGTTDDSNTTGWDKSKLVTGIEVDPSPITVTCTIVIDP
jgi:hypothetical protein